MAPCWCPVFRILYRLLAGVARLAVRTGRSKDLEIIVLRHQLMVLRRQIDRPQLNDDDRGLLGVIAAALPRRLRDGWIITPDMLLRWHRKRIARHWTQPQTRRPGRPPTASELRRLIVRLAADNPTWGHRRVHGELVSLGHTIAPSTVWQILHDHGIDPAPKRSEVTWGDFLRSQASVACDFFTVHTASLRRYYILFFIHIETRQVFFAGVTANPTGTWTTQAARNLFIRHGHQLVDAKALVRDRGSQLIDAFDEIFRTEGFKILKTPVCVARLRTRSPSDGSDRSEESCSTEPSSGTIASCCPPRGQSHIRPPQVRARPFSPHSEREYPGAGSVEQLSSGRGPHDHLRGLTLQGNRPRRVAITVSR